MNNINLDRITIGRYAPRRPINSIDDYDDDDTKALISYQADPFYFFDGKTMYPINDGKGAGAFTGLNSLIGTRKKTLQHTDIDYAIAYTQCEYAFRCVNILAEDIAGLPRGVRTKAGKKPVPNHPLMEALTWARKLYMQDIIALWEKSLRVFGETYIEPTKDEIGIYAGARWLNPIVVEPVILGDKLTGFDYMATGATEHFKPGEIVYDKISSLLDDIRGQSLIGVALDAINIDREIKRYTLDNFIKNMKMAGIVSGRQGSALDQQALDNFIAKLKEQKGERIVAVPQAVEFTRVQQEMDDSQLKVSDDVRRRITTALGIPMSVAGAWDDARYQSAPEQRKHYFESVILREIERLTLVINEVWMPFYDRTDTCEFYFDTTKILALLEDASTKIDMANKKLAAGTITINQHREMLGDKPLPGGDVLMIPSNVILVSLDQLANMAQNPLPPPNMPTTPPAPPPPPTQAALPSGMVQDSTKDATGGLCIMLSVGNNPDLMALQGRVKEYVGDVPCKWNEPSDYHITLIYAPVISDVQAAQLQTALASVELPDMSLPVGSLRTFDNIGEHAVHFRVGANAALYELQEKVFDLCAEIGIPMSSFSEPDSFLPHITMGYAEAKPKGQTAKTKIKVSPSAIIAMKGDLTLYRAEISREAVKTDRHAHSLIASILPTSEALKAAYPQKAALEELAAWQKKVANKQDAHVEFRNLLIRDTEAEHLRGLLRVASAMEDYEAEGIKSAFASMRVLLSIKAVQATRIDFEDKFTDLLNEARNGNLTRSRWSMLARALIKLYGNKAFRDGLKDGGVDDEPDESEQETIAGLIAAQSQYVSNLGVKLFKDENTISDTLAEQKAELWWNGSIAPFYTEGLLSANGNGMFTWVLGNTEEHCPTCPQLDGQRKRYKTWYRSNLIAGTIGQETECGGWKCDCKLKPSAGKSTDLNLDLLETDAA